MYEIELKSGTSLAALVGVVMLSLPAMAQTPAPGNLPAQSPSPAPSAAAPTEGEKPAEAPPPGYYIDGIRLSAQIDAGISLNPSRPGNGLNFGQSFTDRANQPELNQVLLTANKALDPKNPDFQWGFKLQGMYGSDARYTQFLGIFNNALPGARNQFDIVEANALLHLPVLTGGGIDLKAGLYPSPLGYETIDPSTNPFYSHSYIFQFGLPFKHTGALAIAHVTDVVDIYAGLDTGTNTTFGIRGENNSALAGIAGFNLTLMGGNLTILALSHFGPEQSQAAINTGQFFFNNGAPLNVNGQWRYYNDVVITYKASDKLTVVTELNWARDDYGIGTGAANGFGAAQYVSYAVSDTVALNGRAELFRDDHNFFVGAFANSNDPVRFQQGLPLAGTFYGAPGSNTTYTELTAGVTFKPAMPEPVVGLLIRPEVRWDHAWSNRPFNQASGGGGGTPNNFTLAADAVLTF